MQNETQNVPVQDTPTSSPMTTTPEKASASGVIGTIIIIALIILGGLYFWGKRIDNQKEASVLVRQEQQARSEINEIENISDADDTATLKAELEATMTSDLGAELR